MTTTTKSIQWGQGTDWTREWLPLFLAEAPDDELRRIRDFLSGASEEGSSFIEEIWSATHGHLAEMIPMIGDITKEDDDAIRSAVDELERTEPDTCKVRQADTLFLERRFANANRERFIVLAGNLVQYLKDSIRGDRNGPSCDFEAFFKPALVSAGYWKFMGPLLSATCSIYSTFEEVEDMAIFAEFPHDPGNLPLNATDTTTTTCRECSGKGTTTRCSLCSGAGQSEGQGDVMEDCDSCGASGRVASHSCSNCEGKGILRRYPVRVSCFSCNNQPEARDDCPWCERGFEWTLKLSTRA